MNISAWCRDDWNQFIQRTENSTVFCNSFFLEAYEGEVKYYRCVKGDETLAAFAYVESDIGVCEIKPFQAYSAFTIKNIDNYKQYRRNDLIYKIFTAFSDYFFNQFVKVDLNFHPYFIDTRPFQWKNFNERDKGFYDVGINYTTILNIEKPEDTSGYRQSRRYDLNKSFKADCSTSETNQYKILSDLYEMTFARQSISTSQAVKSLMRNIFENSLKMKSGVMFLTEIDQTPASVSFFLYDKQIAYYLWGASNPDFRKCGVGTRNLFDSFNSLHRNYGINEVDMVGVNSPNRGDFKLSFGGMLKPYYTIFKVTKG
jgi:hypothetical protein